jgi:hypothetical protein
MNTERAMSRQASGRRELRLEQKLGSIGEAFRALGYRITSSVFSSRMGATMLSLAGRNGLRGLVYDVVWSEPA